MNNIGVIAIEGIEVYGYHGVYASERKLGNLFKVDIYIEADLWQATQSDNLTDTLDYYEVYKRVLVCMEVPVNLVEHLVGKIGKKLLDDFDSIITVKVRVAKVQPLAMEKCRQTYVEMLFDRAK